MREIDFTKQGGFPLETDTLDFMYKSQQESISMLLHTLGIGQGKYIIGGCDVTNAESISKGWVSIDGVAYEVKQGRGLYLKTVSKSRTVTFEDNRQYEVYNHVYFEPSTDARLNLRIYDFKNNKIPLVKERIREGDILEFKNGAWRTAQHKLMPVGGIIMWSGDIRHIPQGWVLCDGRNATPDLRAKFIVGAGGKYAPRESGGEERTFLTTDDMPTHHHQIRRSNVENFAIATGGQPSKRGSILQGLSNEAVVDSYSAGLGRSHNNIPPFFALAYIMKIG